MAKKRFSRIAGLMIMLILLLSIVASAILFMI